MSVCTRVISVSYVAVDLYLSYCVLSTILRLTSSLQSVDYKYFLMMIVMMMIIF